ncbi:ephexin-1 [Denticeps clupeoides]|uniref:Rho guanine nucleotide exchange factor 15-like n=1 Tax=Denticeps clupeoides TaxID=299321 RepID=A0AAY4EG96_9TELE|nr:rho guanine nucleotide exchange factor 15 [Denticeps clupeoides]
MTLHLWRTPPASRPTIPPKPVLTRETPGSKNPAFARRPIESSATGQIPSESNTTPPETQHVPSPDKQKNWGQELKRPLLGDGCRSAPDGSDEARSGPVVERDPCSPPEPSSPMEVKPCSCICHENRPGMKLVWVPLEDNDVVVAKDDKTPVQSVGSKRAGTNDRSKTGTMKRPIERERKMTQRRRSYAVSKNSLTKKPLKQADYDTPPPPYLCFSQETHGDDDYECMDDDPPSPATPNRLQQSAGPSGLQGQTHKPGELDTQSSPARAPRKAGTPPPIPPRPVTTHQEKKPHPATSGKVALNQRTSVRPALSFMLSPRGGRPPIRPKASQVSSATDEYEDLSCDCEMETEDELEDGPRRISSDWQPTQDYEPLYQIYQAKVIEEAINQKTSCSKRSRCSLASDPHLDPELEGPGGRRGPEEVTLWQDLPVVKESGMLDKLSHVECQRQESMFEVLTSEASYLRSLKVLKEHFLGSRELNDTLLVHDRKTLFSNIQQVFDASERFMIDLLERVDKCVVISDVCDIIHHHATNHFSVYIDYLRDQVYQEKTYSALMQSNRCFALVMRRLEDSPLCRRLPFTSFLLLPFQRITRIKILTQNILKRTPEGSDGESSASQALAVVSEIIKEANTQVGQMKQMEELIHIANQLEFNKLKAVPVVTKARFLEKQGELQELSKGGSLFSVRLKLTPVYLFLFNDLLILSTKKSAERFVVMDHAHRSLVQVKAAGDGEPGPRFEHAFSLTILENHQGHRCERLLKANTESDMHRWMAAFPSVVDPHTLSEEVVYDSWDCPQVQCVERYAAQQADELTLEPTDIINVTRKTHEGWYEGIRLADGLKGWFPKANVMDITNEHHRRRNLREQYRILQAASRAAKT